MDLKAIQAALIFGGGKADTSSGIPPPQLLADDH